MIWYILLILIILLFRIVFIKNNKVFCLFSGLLLWGMLALRSVQIGIYDTLNIYKPLFEMAKFKSVYSLTNNWWVTDNGFIIITKIIAALTNNYQVFIAILAAPFIILIMKYINKESKYPLLSIIIFISLYYLYGTFLLRQVISIAILTLAIEQIEKKNIKKFLIIVLIASLFHKTSLVFLVAYPFATINKFGKNNYIIIIASYLLSMFFAQYIIKYIPYLDFTGKTSLALKYGIYDTSGNVSLFGFIMNVLIIVFSDIMYKDKTDARINYYLNIATLGAALFAFSKVISEMYRISIYFSIINIIMIPYTLTKIKSQKNRFVIEINLILIFILYFLTRTINNVNANPYMFYFN